MKLLPFLPRAVHAVLLASALWVLTPASAQQAPVATKSDSATPDRLEKTLKARFPQLTIKKVQPSQWPWLYEVATDNELFYVDATGDYLFYGKILDTKNKVDLTEARWNQLTKISFNELPLNLAMKLVKGDGSRKLAVFADPHCPYCVRFEKTLQEVTNVTVYTFMLPLESIHPGATEHAKKLWCAENRQAAWSSWMLSKSEAPTKTCDASSVDTLVALGDKLKVNGTPTLFFEDGHRIPGAIDKDRLEDEFKNSKATPN